MTDTYIEIINYELEYLANYINHLVEFNKEIKMYTMTL